MDLGIQGFQINSSELRKYTLSMFACAAFLQALGIQDFQVNISEVEHTHSMFACFTFLYISGHGPWDPRLPDQQLGAAGVHTWHVCMCCKGEATVMYRQTRVLNSKLLYQEMLNLGRPEPPK
jgi:hypothetical protein